MTKVLKITGRTLGILGEWLLVFVLFLSFAIRTPWFQTEIAQQLSAYLSSELDSEVKVERLAITFFDEIAVDGLLIMDQNKDTLIRIDRLFATFSNVRWNAKHYTVSGVDAEGALVHIQRDTSGRFNHDFLVQYFKPKTKKTKPKISFDVKTASLKDSRFRYDDHRKGMRESGIDFFHLDLRDINTTIKHIEVEDLVIKSEVVACSFKEKSGFRLKNLRTRSTVSAKGIALRGVTITTPKSILYAKRFDMRSKSYNCFKYFVDSVSFNGTIDSSRLDLRDVAYFASPLKGMNDEIRLKGKIQNTVSKLQLANVELRYKDQTRLKGDFSIPDYRAFQEGNFDEQLDYVYLDLNELETLKLPEKAGVDYITINPTLRKAGDLSAKNLRIAGNFESFIVSAHQVSSAIGSASFPRGIHFEEAPEKNGYYFNRNLDSGNYVMLQDLNLGSLIDNPSFNLMSGQLAVSGKIDSLLQYDLGTIDGNLTRFDYLNYAYQNITISGGSFVDKVVQGKVIVEDPALSLAYEGTLDLKGEQHMNFLVDIKKAELHTLQLSDSISRFKTTASVDLAGKKINDIEGLVTLTGSVYSTPKKDIHVPHVQLNISKSNGIHQYTIDSEVIKGSVVGRINFEQLYADMTYQLSHIFPSLFKKEITKLKRETIDNFTYDFEFRQTDELLSVLVPDLKIAPGTRINGHYFGETNNFITNITSNKINYAAIAFNQFTLFQIMDSNSLVGTYHFGNIIYNDSMRFDDVYYHLKGSPDQLLSDLTWEGKTNTPSRISWKTKVMDWDKLNFVLDPSYFYVKGNRWDIANTSTLKIVGDTIEVDKFQLNRDQQLVVVDGKISHNKADHLNFKVSDFELSEISGFVSNKYVVSGRLNAWGYVADPFGQVEYIGDAHLKKLEVNGQEIGDVFFLSEWNSINNSVFAQGDLIYKGNQTFDFEGNYYTERVTDQLDFELIFDYTDIRFTNAFMDPDVMSDIRGILVGSVHLGGNPTAPKINGTVELQGGSTYVDILGVHFGVNGPIEVDEYGFYMNNIPVFDEEGNAGYLVGSVYHDNYTNFNFDLAFDLERDAVNRDPVHFWKVVPLKKFLIMESEYEPGSIYYGRGYATGTVNIFGYTNNLEINVDLNTQKGTQVNFPMYGMGDIDEETEFIVFKEKSDSLFNAGKDKFNFTGVNLNLNFHVTPDAEVKIVFDENLGDEISAQGSGDISIKLDNLGDIRMDGVYTVNNGVYNFVMGIVKQKFFIEEGGTINWTGDPYDANLNLKTYYKVNANIADISQDIIASGSGSHQPVFCYLNLSESLLKPTIEFSIRAPQANDVARSLIARVNNDKDELNRQFFSLLLWKRFQPLANSTQSAGSAAGDLIENQINSLLSMVSTEYRMNVNFDSDQLTGDKQYEFGITKSFMNDRLVLSGSFGVENRTTTESSIESGLIGDLSLEYLLNETGTFRVNVFNESTDKTIIQKTELGRFTQGAGLNYKEDFNKFSDFKAVQFVLDLFRKQEKKRFPQKKEQRPVPTLPKEPTPTTSLFRLPKGRA